MPPDSPQPADAPPPHALRDGAILFLGLLVFWWLFSTFVESFYRDDNVGGIAPLLGEAARQILSGHLPGHTYAIGGGGGADLSRALLGLYDPLTTLPALLLHDRPEGMMNLILSLHLAAFGAGAWYLAVVMRAPRWAGLLAALALGTCGDFFVWGGNWVSVLVPFTFLPWLLGGTLAALGRATGRRLIAHELVACFALLGVFCTGLLFAAYYGGLAILTVLASLRWRGDLGGPRRVLTRLAPMAAVFVVVVVPMLVMQMRTYNFYGARENDAASWILFTVPPQAYVGLFLPTTSAVWLGPFYPDGQLFTNILMMAGIVPAWYLLATAFTRPRVFARPAIACLLGGLALLIVVLSPNAFGLEGAFARMPVLNAFRWPFRAIPAFHLLMVVLFLAVVIELRASPGKLQRILLFTVCIGGTLASIGHDLTLASEPEAVKSWFQGAPPLDDEETWSTETLATLATSGHIANVCLAEDILHGKPRLFFYGNMAPAFGVRTVHIYAVPPPRAYAPLAMSIKGCMRNWPGVRALIERGPRAPLAERPSWDDPRGPSSFGELVAKTYVGAVIVDKRLRAPMAYFRDATGWRLLEEHDAAALFVRSARGEVERAP